MTHTCPACGAQLTVGRVRARYRASRRVGWFRYSPTTFVCPACRVELRQRINPLGWLFLFFCAAAMAAIFLATAAVPSLRSLSDYVVPIALLGAAPFIFCFATWGFQWQLKDRPKTKP